MNCPLCGGNCQSLADSQSNAVKFNCKKYERSFKIGATVDVFRNENKQRRLNNLIFEHLLREPYADEQETYWHFFYEPAYRISEKDKHYHVNLAEIAYPKNLSDKIDRIILNLYRINPSYGYTFCMDASIARAFFAETAQEEECIGIAYLMEELEYLFQANDGGYRIAAKGWQRIDELLRQSSEKRQAFIAMAFKQETQKIREAFKKSIVAAGYTPLAIDEKEHNNQIVPEIFDEIGKSSFLVMDVTEPNYGAYYEAGYALGKGKQVIICCQEAAFKNFDSRPHFDIAQKSMIVWQTEEELVERLKKRIIATMK